MMKKEIKLYLITGFLGSGKTTLLESLLNFLPEDSGKKTGVIINEFGKVNVDGKVIKKEGIELTEINNGSVFCKCLEGSFIEQIIAFSKIPVNYLFIESSGLSDPSNMQSILEHVNKFTDGAFAFEGNICVVDALNFLKVLNTLNTVEKQIIHSDFVIVNKIDLVDQMVVDKVTEKIRQINPGAKVIKTTYCQITEDVLNSNIRAEKRAAAASTLNTPFNRPQTILVKTDDLVDEDGLLRFVDDVKAKALRAKGFVKTSKGAFKLDVVGDRVELKKIDLTRDSEITVISKPNHNIADDVRSSWVKHIGNDFILR